MRTLFELQTMVLYDAGGQYPRDWESLWRRAEGFGFLIGELDAEARRLVGTSRKRARWRRVFGER